MTERLYYNDSYVKEFTARIVETTEDGRRVYLDRTAFYSASGGQPFDLGTLGGIEVREVVDEEERIAHVLESPLAVGEIDARFEAQVDWRRRFDHMQQHTGQHLLSAVLMELFEIPTVSFHMGAESSTIDLGAPSLTSSQIEKAEERCAEIVAEARPVTITFEDAGADLGLRKASARSGTLRIISIDGIDRSACGGTHVRSTSEIGAVFLRKLDKIRGNARIEFVCGGRALRAARSDFQHISEIARRFSCSIEDAASSVAAQFEKAQTLEKTCRRLSVELAAREGRELYAATAPDEQGFRRVTERGAITDSTRAKAHAFAAASKAVFLAVCEDPPSLLLAVSADSGIHAGDRIKAAVTGAGGRGGGNQTLGQGSVPTVEVLPALLVSLGF